MKCFVIMPFSTTNSCKEEEWTDIFVEVIKPAVEGCSFTCHRSVATRGNIIKDIINDLNDADVVIADLTDQNPNVMYELGVRHSLASKTIIIAQDRNHIPFDLRPYANHTYGWKTKKEKEEFKLKIKELLEDVVTRPNRIDNPVHDFLDETLRCGLRFFSSIREAPQFGELVESAIQEVLALGPNLNYVAQNLRNLVFDKARQGISVKFLLMGLDNTPCDLIKDYASVALFHDELKLCHETFKAWLKDAKISNLDIEVRIAPIVPISVNIIDGNTYNGKMIVIPIPYRTPGAERPCFLLDKKVNDKAFSTYYERFKVFWNQSTPLT